MVDFKKLTDRAKDIVEQRGGSDSVKQDLNELKDIARGQGTAKDKLRDAAQALREPGARDAPAPAPTATTPSGGATPPAGATTPDDPAAARPADDAAASGRPAPGPGPGPGSDEAA